MPRTLWSGLPDATAPVDIGSSNESDIPRPQAGISPDSRKPPISASKRLKSARLRTMSWAPATAAKIARAFVSHFFRGIDAEASILASQAMFTSAKVRTSVFTAGRHTRRP